MRRRCNDLSLFSHGAVMHPPPLIIKRDKSESIFYSYAPARDLLLLLLAVFLPLNFSSNAGRAGQLIAAMFFKASRFVCRAVFVFAALLHLSSSLPAGPSRVKRGAHAAELTWRCHGEDLCAFPM